jgi:hypothetical protein
MVGGTHVRARVLINKRHGKTCQVYGEVTELETLKVFPADSRPAWHGAG